MTDLRDRWAEADGLRAPDLWGEARRRSASPGATRLDDRGPSGPRRVAVAALALAVGAAAVTFAWQAIRPGPRPLPTLPRPAADPFADFAEGWTGLPPPPDVRTGAATGWTGSQVLVWGGYLYAGTEGTEDTLADGYVWDPLTGRSEVLPPSPLDGRANPAYAWTGTELLIWGGWKQGAGASFEYFDDGAAFNPSTRTWRTLPAAPVAARSPFFVWTGDELLVSGSATRNRRMIDGAAYDPGTNSWRRIQDAPAELTDATAVWTGDEMIVFGAALHGGNRPETPTAIGVAYDVGEDSWRRLPVGRLSPQASTAAWDGRSMIAWDYENGAEAYDPAGDRWRALPDVPLRFFECVPRAVAVPPVVVGDSCGREVTWADGTWTEITPPWGSHSPLVVSLMPTSSAVLFTASDESFERGAWVYRPPTTATPEAFAPPTSVVDGRAHMPLTFPDGSSAVISYPSSLDLGGLDLTPQVSYLLVEDPAPRFPIVFLHGPRGVERQHVAGPGPLGTVTSRDGRPVEHWAAADALTVLVHRDVRQEWLVFETPSWTVLASIPDRMSAAEAAASMVVNEVDGFPVVRASRPIALSHESGEGEGPRLSFSGSAGGADTTLELWLEPCTARGLETGGSYGAGCLDGRIQFNVYGSPAFVQALVEGIALESFASPTS
jgi:hypothetical protein